MLSISEIRLPKSPCMLVKKERKEGVAMEGKFSEWEKGLDNRGIDNRGIEEAKDAIVIAKKTRLWLIDAKLTADKSILTFVFNRNLQSPSEAWEYLFGVPPTPVIRTYPRKVVSDEVWRRITKFYEDNQEMEKVFKEAYISEEQVFGL